MCVPETVSLLRQMTHASFLFIRISQNQRKLDKYKLCISKVVNSEIVYIRIRISCQLTEWKDNKKLIVNFILR